MSQTFTDDDLRVWEAFASGGKYGLSIRPKVIFHCVTEPGERPRFVELHGDEADAEDAVHDASVDRLKEMLRASKELE